MTNKERETQSLAAVLDFYSDKSDAHASFFLASLFGLFTVLSITQGFRGEPVRYLLLIPYWLLFFGGLYSLLNFGLYATLARSIKVRIQNETIRQAEGLLEYPRYRLLLFFWHLKRGRVDRVVVIGGFYVIAASVSCFVVFELWITELWSWILFLALVIGVAIGASWLVHAHNKFFSRRERVHRFWESLLTKSSLTVSRGARLFDSERPVWRDILCVEKDGLRYCYYIFDSSSRVFLQLAGTNKKLFEHLRSQRERIEADIGEARVKWVDEESQVGFYIVAIVTENVGLKDHGKWDELQKNMIYYMTRLESTIEEKIRDLQHPY